MQDSDKTTIDRMLRDGRRIATEVITTTMTNARVSGIPGRAILTGLWQASIGTLLDVADPEQAISVLNATISEIKGHGNNADAKPLILVEESARKRREESSTVAQMICAALTPLAQNLEDPDLLPEIVLDAAVSILVDTWGPVHLRKALAEQVDSLEHGGTSPILPAEPTTHNQPPRPASGRPGRPVYRPPVPQPPPAEPAPPPSPRDDAPPLDDAPPPPVEFAEDAGFKDETFDPFTPPLPAESAPEPSSLPDPPHGDSWHEHPSTPAADDGAFDFASALEALDGSIPVPSAAGRAAHADPRPPVKAPAAEAQTESPDAVRAPEQHRHDDSPVTADDIMAILDSPPPETEGAEPVLFDDMPKPPPVRSDPAATPTAWYRMAHAEPEDLAPRHPGDGFADSPPSPDEAPEPDPPEPATPPRRDAADFAPVPEAAGTAVDFPGEADFDADFEHGVETPPVPAFEPAVAPHPEPDAAPPREPERGPPAPPADGQDPTPAPAPPRAPEAVPAQPPASAPAAPVPASVLDRPQTPAPAERPARTPAASRLRGIDKGRSIDVLVSVEPSETCDASVYVAIVDIESATRRERREVDCVLRGTKGRRAILMSFIDLLSTLGDPVEGETVRIHTDSSMLITGMLPEAQRPLAARPMSEENLWAVVDALCADRQMHTIRRKPGISNAKAEICDRIMRMKLEEISR